jgi:hypothetical protein
MWRNGKERLLKTQLEAAAPAKSLAEKPAKRSEEEIAEKPSEPAEQEDEPLEQKAWLGLMIRQSDAPGVEIARIYLGSPAAKAGLRPGDRIVKLNGETIQSPQDMATQIRGMTPGDPVNLVVSRDGRRQTVELAAGDLEDFHERLFGQRFRRKFDDFHALFDPDFDGIPDRILLMRPPFDVPPGEDAPRQGDPGAEEAEKEQGAASRQTPQVDQEDSSDLLLRDLLRELKALRQELRNRPALRR